MRLNKYLAHSGVASRRQSDALIKQATTFVNGKLITDPAFPVTEKDNIVFEGKKLSIVKNSQVFLFHKPLNVVTTTFDPQGRKTVLDYVKTGDRIFPIGRLDRRTTGLLLLTNDGELSNKLLHPKFGVPRIYEAEIEGILDHKTIRKIAKGIFIGQGEFGRAEVLKQKKIKKRSTVHLRLFTGKKREIRRIFSFLNVRLFSLKRIQYGPILLGDLPIGEWRPLNNTELNQLKNGKRG
ncbi:MAG: pseudouridine synthase [Candidatus Marinimicrobia bacterium]|jgi:23S rRNA pseudouridine2605 synthase|nr:pseudouridine synthase [Candidatus Neomarinimicrobiota bacterium]